MSNAIANGTASLGIELGSTRIKVCLIDDADASVLATGASDWENRYIDGVWTYGLDEVWAGIASAYAQLRENVQTQYRTPLENVSAIGVSAMMHGYLALDASGELLVPFRTWRNTNTGEAAQQLTTLFGQNIPHRWSIAHLFQAILNDEPHIPQLAGLTTLAGYVHWGLTGEWALGVGDASGMFPIAADTLDYDERCIEAFDQVAPECLKGRLSTLLPRVLVAGDVAGKLTDEGARLIDSTGSLRSGVPMCPPEGDAGTGMVATGAVAARTGNVSVGTSVFAMVVLEGPLTEIHTEIDLVTTPAGDPVAMVHCNNGASELAAWASLFTQFAEVLGVEPGRDEVYAALFQAAQSGSADGVLAYNQLSGEPIAGLEEGRPAVIRTPGSELTLSNFMRAQLNGVFATLCLGMNTLASENVAVDRMHAHGGVFRTAGVAQQTLADALAASVSVSDTASEGGAWGMALLASYLRVSDQMSLRDYLARLVFDNAAATVCEPDPSGVIAYQEYLTHYQAGLSAVRAAAEALPAR